MKQLKLFSDKKEVQYGGSLMEGKRKNARPFDSTKPIHMVLKATNPYVLLKHRVEIDKLLKCYGKKLGVQIYDVAVNADHIHLVIRGRRDFYHRWIRAVTSILVRRFVGLKWKFRPYTRIGAWGREFAILKNYLVKNRGEGRLIVSAEDNVEEFALAIRRQIKKATSMDGFFRSAGWKN